MSHRKPYAKMKTGDLRHRSQRYQRAMDEKGTELEPVELNGRRTIATTFWGKAWCKHFERARDYANRLPRGRTYVRHNAVVDLQIEPGRISALVVGSRRTPYEVDLHVNLLHPSSWEHIVEQCTGEIDALLDLLEGRLNKAVIAVLCDEKSGMMPHPVELEIDCTCPDWAFMCKHAAATLYGVAARLDESPELLFALRGVDPSELLHGAFTAVEPDSPDDDPEALALEEDLEALFGIELDDDDAINEALEECLVTSMQGEREPVAEPNATAAETPHHHRSKGNDEEKGENLSEEEGDDHSGDWARVVWVGIKDRLERVRDMQRIMAYCPQIELIDDLFWLVDPEPLPDAIGTDLLTMSLLDELVFTTEEGDAWGGIALQPDTVDPETLETCLDGEHFLNVELPHLDVLIWRLDYARVMADPEDALWAFVDLKCALVEDADESALWISWLYGWLTAWQREGTTLLEEGLLDEILEPVIDCVEIPQGLKMLVLPLLGLEEEAVVSAMPGVGTQRKSGRTLRDVMIEYGVTLHNG